MDVINYRKDEDNPILNYKVILEGNPKVASAFAHIKNMIPSLPDRPEINPDGSRSMDPDNGQHKMLPVGEHPLHWPIREDTSILCAQEYNALQVDDTEAVPFKMVRYPREDGQFKAAQQQARAKWFQENLGMPKGEAEELAFDEMDSLFQMEPGRTWSTADPLKSLVVIGNRLNNDTVQPEVARDAYWEHFRRLDERLIMEIPMQTYHKTRYFTMQNLDIYPEGELPKE